MGIKAGARLHMEGLRIVQPGALQLGEVVTLLPYLWKFIGIVCEFQSKRIVVFLNVEERIGSFFHNVEQLDNSDALTQYVVIPGATIVPFIDADNFNAPNPTRYSIALVKDCVAVRGWINHGSVLFDAVTGKALNASTERPVNVLSWDLLVKDIDDDVVSLLEVRP